MDNTSLFLSDFHEEDFLHLRRIHFIGVLGAGMRSLAHMALDRGFSVSGSDSAVPSEGDLWGLCPLSAPGEDASGIYTADLAVFSLAIAEDDPEILIAKERGIPLVSRADFLGAMMRGFRECIGVAGTHGKSTVTAMCAAILAAADVDPTVALGAPLPGQADGYRPGKGDVFVFEACEYKHSFLSFFPSVAVLLNAEWDHPDCFESHSAILDAFCRYLTLPSVRVAILPYDDPYASSLAEHLSVPIITFGTGEGADIRARRIECKEGGASFLLSVYGQQIGLVSLSVFGSHNVANALAAYAAAYAIGILPDPGALSGFLGIGRRLQYRGSYAGARYYDDYAHHPTEINAGIAAFCGCRRLIVVFQPHTYSRTAALLSDLAAALRMADLVIVTDVYAAREKNESGITSRALVAAIGPRAIYMPTPETAALAVRTRAKKGDTVLVMGAGDLSARFFCGPLAFV